MFIDELSLSVIYKFANRKMLYFRSFLGKKRVYREIVKLAEVEIINKNEKWDNYFLITVVLKVWTSSISITRNPPDLEFGGIQT